MPDDLYSLKSERHFQRVIKDSRQKQATWPTGIIFISFGGSINTMRKNNVKILEIEN